MVGPKAASVIRSYAPHTLLLSLWAKRAFRRYYLEAQKRYRHPREIDVQLASDGFVEVRKAFAITENLLGAIEKAFAANETWSLVGPNNMVEGTHPESAYTYLSSEGFRRLDIPSLLETTPVIDRLERHLGSHVRVPYIDVYRTYPNRHTRSGSFLWHRDHQPRNTYKVLVYLNDVDLDNGPFGYIPGSHKLYNGLPQFGGSRRADQHPRDFYRFLGARGDAILFDVNGFHMGGVCERRTRLIMVISLIPSKISWRAHMERYGFAVVPNIENYFFPERVWWKQPVNVPPAAPASSSTPR